MPQPKPVLQEIRDRFDHFDETAGDRSRSSSMKIMSTDRGYTVTTYPAGTYGYEGFTADIQTPYGIFGEEGPTRVEMSREPDRVRRFIVSNVAVNEDGIAITTLQVSPTVARESLLLPGDPGFDLFDRLHEELAKRRALIAKAIGTLGVEIEPTSFVYISQTTSAGSNDHENRIATDMRGTHVEVGGTSPWVRQYREHTYAKVELDGTRTAHMPTDGSPITFPPNEPMVFRSGHAEINWQSSERHLSEQLSDEALSAFAYLHADFSDLYS